MNKVHHCTVRIVVGGVADVGMEINNSSGNVFSELSVDIITPSKAYEPKPGRNALCPCGSAVKFKKCHGVRDVSTGIKLDDSTFTVGKATIVADVGIDAKNKSHAHAEEFLHIAPEVSPELMQILQRFQINPPRDVLAEAWSDVQRSKSPKILEKSKLKAWILEQGLGVAFWAEIAVAIAGIALAH
ncbi:MULTISPECIES: YecA family protein [unclassified Pseudomonas]|uniref:YecA family protein n=1 Tax=unclassified Pseudomonas TaxID=196821 RepID=UPI0025D69427|nr:MULTISPECIES: SEC-C domain-containing protein [unclassified Pseudomonas]